MTKTNDDATLNDLMASDEAFAESLYRAPRETISKVAGAIRQQVHQDFTDYQTQQTAKKRAVDRMSQFFKLNPDLVPHRHEVLGYLDEQVRANPKLSLANVDDDDAVQEGFEKFADMAGKYIAERKRLEKDPDYQDSLIMRGGLGTEDEVDPAENVSDYRLSDMIRSRRNVRRGKAG